MTVVRVSTRDAILEAGFAIFSRSPDASLADVAAHAGVGRATLHRHFESRDVLMVALAQAAMDELNFAVDTAVSDAESHLDGLEKALYAVIPLADRQLFLAQERVEQDPKIAAAYDADRRELVDALRGAQAEGALDASVAPEWLAAAYDSLIYAAWEMVRDGDATPKQAAAFAWRVFIKGVTA
ncbi:MAG: TetR/AcrR family transcriptional regulator [Pseudomonadota bacterium]